MDVKKKYPSKPHMLSGRCYFSNICARACSVVPTMDENQKLILQNLGVLQIFEAPRVPQNIPLIYVLMSSYDARKNIVCMGSKEVTFSIDGVALILGLQNKGEDVNYSAKPYADITKNALKKQLADMASKTTSVDLNALILHLLCNFFFPASGDRIPEVLVKLSEPSEFRRHNWPKAIHSHLSNSMKHIAERVAVFAKVHLSVLPNESIGYMHGCTHILVIWFLEHTTICSTMDPERRPRIARWSEKTSFNLKHLIRLFPNLRRNQVLAHFDNITTEENALCSGIFKSPTKKRRKISSSSIEPTSDSISPPLEHPTPASLVELMKMISALHELVDRKFDSLTSKFDELDRKVDSLASNFHELDRKVDSLTSKFDEHVRSAKPSHVFTIEDSPLKQRTSSFTKVDDEVEPYPEDYPGKNSLTQEQRDLIHQRMSLPKTRNHVAFRGYNIIGIRESMEDLLNNQYVSDCHVDAFAKILEYRRESDELSWRSFIYVSPNLWLHNQKVTEEENMAGLKIYANSLTKSNVEKAAMIFMPVCRNTHWFFLLGILSKLRWVLHDSLYNPTRKDLCKQPIEILQRAARDVGYANANFKGWKLVLAKSIPRQVNSVDCGVYVMKYMEHIARSSTTDWSNCVDWSEKMPFFRAEIAYEIFKHFNV